MSGRPLLCELHAHSTWSDGDLSIPELVDLYGTSGFDVLCVTDHVGRSGARWHDPRWRITGAQAFSDYLGEIEQEAWRADVEYGLLLVPGLELTYDDDDPARSRPMRSRSACAPGLPRRRARDRADRGPGRRRGADRRPSVLARRCRRRPPVGPVAGQSPGMRSRGLVDRYELINRREIFPWVAEAGLLGVASGDFHRHEHLRTWKTLLCCAPSRAVAGHVPALDRPAYLVDLAEPALLEAAA